MSNAHWIVKHRKRPTDPSPNYPQHDDGKPGFLPYSERLGGYAPKRCLSSRDCQEIVAVLNDRYADRDVDWLRDNWEVVLGEVGK